MPNNNPSNKAQVAGIRQQRNENIEAAIAEGNNLDGVTLTYDQQEEVLRKKDFEQGEARAALNERKAEAAKERAEEAAHHQHQEHHHTASESIPGTVKSHTDVRPHNELVPDSTPGKGQARGRGEGMGK